MRLLFTVPVLMTLQQVLGQEFQCALEKIDSGEYCVFRGVNLRKNTASARFTYPADIAKPSQVSFMDSNMKHLPSNFLTLAGPELKVLRVENCGLVSVTVTSGLEALYAKGNSIEKVVVHQSGSGGPLRTLDLSGNKISDFSNVTRCQALEELSLSGNELEDVLDLGKFSGLNNLRKLDLSHNNINYLDNTGNVSLESLEDLDLSHNNILPSDLNIAIFYPYSKLHTLRFNDNLMAQLDYNHLLNIKQLRMVYLNGNNFNCTYLDSMLKHLQQNRLQTPPGESNSCPERNLNEFCCTGPLPVKPTPSTSTTTPTTTTTKPTKSTTESTPIIVKPTETTSPTSRTTTTTTTEQPSVNTPPVTGNDGGDGDSSPILWIIAAISGIVAVIGILTLVLVKKKHAYKQPPENMELSKV